MDNRTIRLVKAIEDVGDSHFRSVELELTLMPVEPGPNTYELEARVKVVGESNETTGPHA